MNQRNDKNDPDHRTLDLDFEVMGDSSYTVNLYVDKNHDNKFSSDERAKSLDGSYNLPAISGKK